MLKIVKANEVFCFVDGPYDELKAVSDKLSFEIPGAAFNPLVRSGRWDGIIRLLPLTTQKLYIGLAPTLARFARQLKIEAMSDFDFNHPNPITPEDIDQFVSTLAAPFTPHDFQSSAAAEAINQRRGIWLVPTSGGKTFLTYIIAMYTGLRTLVVVPTTTLVRQLLADFKSYGYRDQVHQIMEGASKQTSAMVTVSTWQSIHEQPAIWFNQFGLFVGDEVHGFQSKSLSSMMEKTTEIEYKIGLTGSLSGSKTHEMVLTGLFGPVHVVTTTRELMDRGIVSDMKIKVIRFHYGDALPNDRTYKEEDTFILAHERRNQFIVNLVNSLDGNVVILFRKVEKHGHLLFKMLTEKSDKDLHYIHGGVKSAKRSDIVAYLEKNNDQVALTSDGTFGTGTSVKNVQHIIRVNPIKAVINNVQGIGRGLRLDGKENHVDYYDLADIIDLNTKYRKEGYLATHSRARIEIYKESRFDYKIFDIDMRD
jgi:superfamily II DNA or RNA helicase